MRPDNRALCAGVINARAAHEQTPTLRTKRDLDAAVNAVVVANMGLVTRLARPRARRVRHMTLEDLVHEGAFGIMRALETFDPSRGLAFSTYASTAPSTTRSTPSGCLRAFTRPRQRSPGRRAPFGPERAVRSRTRRQRDLPDCDRGSLCWRERPPSRWLASTY